MEITVIRILVVLMACILIYMCIDYVIYTWVNYHQHKKWINDYVKNNQVKFYVARDKDGSLWLYSCKPIRGYTQFYCRWNERIFSLDCKAERFGMKKKDYDYLKWEDEPVEVFLNLEN